MQAPEKPRVGRPPKGEKFPRPFAFKTDRPPNLSERFACFAEWHALDGNGKRAAERVGISSGQAAKRAVLWMRREDVRTYAESLRAEVHESGTVLLPGSRDWIRARYISIASVSAADLITRDDDTGQLRWKTPDELTPAQRAAIADVQLSELRPRSSRNSTRKGGEPEPQVQNDRTLEAAPTIVVTGYKLHSAAAALDALARVEGMHAPAPAQRHQVNVRHVFEAVARSEATSETSARIRSAHVPAGSIIEGEAAEVRPLRKLRGV